MNCSKICSAKFIIKGNKLYVRVSFLGISHKFYLGDFIEFYWIEKFEEYFKKNNIKQKVKKLKKGMDKISCEYIDHFMKLSEYWKGYKKNIWTKYDEETEKRTQEFLKTFKQPFPEILYINPYMMANAYGLIDLPKEVFGGINGKAVVDGGGLCGDTALLFHKYFPESSIYVFEPLSVNIEKINSFLKIDNCSNKIIPIQKGLGEKSEVVEICYGENKNMAEIIPLDSFKEFSSPLGLIKLDTEGFETAIFKGALELIKRDKPVLAIAMYHTPEDFFDLKSKIENLNLGYKFMIRRSENILPQADLVLIAY